MKNKFLYYIYCALGEKSHECNKTADRVAFIRLLITLQILITNFFIIGGVILNGASIIRHWNDSKQPHEIQRCLPAKQIKANCNILQN